MKRLCKASAPHAIISLLVTATLVAGCQVVREGPRKDASVASATTTRAAPDSAANVSAPAHNVRVYVSAVNCEMNSADARRINAVAHTGHMPIEVVFTGIQDNNLAILQQATRDLGLEVPTRIARAGELEQYKSIGGAYLPMALVTRARQLKTIIAGETMPRTLSLIETSLSPGAGQ